MDLKVAPGVVFEQLSTELFTIAEAYWYACLREGVQGVVTGAQGGYYRKDGAHQDSRGLDFRSRDLKAPLVAAETIREILKEEGLEAVVIFGPPDHLDHIHVHYVPTDRT